MKYSDSIAQATEKMHAVTAFFHQYQLAPTPVNYHVTYEYLSNRNTELSNAINEHIAQQRLDNFALDQLFDEFINQAQQFSQTLTSESTEIVQQLSNSLDMISSAADNYLQALDNSIQQINTETTTVKGSVSQLLDATYEVKSAHRQFQELLIQIEKRNSNLEQKIDEMKREQFIDQLTGLTNGRGLQLQFDQWLLSGESKALTMIVADIDNFAQFNQQYGHLVGDVIINKVAQKLKGYVNESGIPVRVGGEEFAILLPETSIDIALEIAEQMRLGVEKMRFVSAKSKLRLPKITVSMGVSAFRLDDSLPRLLQRAQTAMSLAKQHGRNRIQQESKIN